MQDTKLFCGTLPYNSNRILLCRVLIVFGFLLLVISCNDVGPGITDLQEQVVYTKSDPLDIAALATTVHSGTIQNITIFHKNNVLAKPITVSGIFSLPPLTNRVFVTFEPEIVQPKLKRYYSLRLSNVTWLESEQPDNGSKLIKNNWVTSRDWLSMIEKAVLNLDSCTIEVTISMVDIDTVEQLLNKISAHQYSYEADVEHTVLRVNEISSISMVPDCESYNFYIRCNYSESYNILYKNGEVCIKGYSRIYF